MMGRLLSVLGVLAALFGSSAARAADGPKPLFADDSVIHVTIRAPITGLINAANASTAPRPGTLTVEGGEALPIQLSVRGRTRREKDVCQFPPLRVEFPNKPVAPALFAGQKSLKLVTHCQASPGFQQYVLIEYSAYRLYNLLTPFSFRARLAQVDYVGDDGRPITSRIGYFLEDDGDVAKRNGLTKAHAAATVPLARLSAADAGRVAVFEYMIGNLDWAITAGPEGTHCCHNTKLITAPDAPNGRLIPLPYDFDFSGLVDAPYATPPEAVPMPNVRVRRYRGFCLHNAEARAAAADMLSNKAEMLAVYDAVPQLDEGRKKKALAYLGGFFDAISTPQSLESKLLSTCLR